jgi:hypothetical protein
MKIKNLRSSNIRKPRKYRFWKSVWVLIVFMVFIAFAGHKTKIAEVKDVQAQTFQQEASTATQQLEEVASENEELKRKLENSSKVQTDDRTKELVRFYIKKYFGADSDRAERVFTCESGLSPKAAGTNTGLHAGSVDRGVAQINDKFHKARFEKMYGISFEIGAHDIDMNLKYAKFLYDHSGFNPWVCRKVLK